MKGRFTAFLPFLLQSSLQSREITESLNLHTWSTSRTVTCFNMKHRCKARGRLEPVYAMGLFYLSHPFLEGDDRNHPHNAHRLDQKFLLIVLSVICQSVVLRGWMQHMFLSSLANLTPLQKRSDVCQHQNKNLHKEDRGESNRTRAFVGGPF